MAGIEILVTGATGLTGHAAIRHLLKSGHRVRAFAHRKDERSDALIQLGAEVVFGDFNDFASIKNALEGIKRAYFCYPISKGLVQATVLFGQAAKEQGLQAIVNMSQKIAREDAASHASFEHWLSERVSFYFLSVKEPVACWPATSAGLRSACRFYCFLSSAVLCAAGSW